MNPLDPEIRDKRVRVIRKETDPEKIPRAAEGWCVWNYWSLPDTPDPNVWIGVATKDGTVFWRMDDIDAITVLDDESA